MEYSLRIRNEETQETIDGGIVTLPGMPTVGSCIDLSHRTPDDGAIYWVQVYLIKIPCLADSLAEDQGALSGDGIVQLFVSIVE